MNSDLHDLRALLTQALHKINQILDQPADPRLPVLTHWLEHADSRHMRAAQLYVLVKDEMQLNNLPIPTQGDIRDMLRSLGYTNKRTHAGMVWSKP